MCQKVDGTYSPPSLPHTSSLSISYSDRHTMIYLPSRRKTFAESCGANEENHISSGRSSRSLVRSADQEPWKVSAMMVGGARVAVITRLAVSSEGDTHKPQTSPKKKASGSCMGLPSAPVHHGYDMSALGTPHARGHCCGFLYSLSLPA